METLASRTEALSRLYRADRVKLSSSNEAEIEIRQLPGDEFSVLISIESHWVWYKEDLLSLIEYLAQVVKKGAI